MFMQEETNERGKGNDVETEHEVLVAESE